MWFLGNGLPKWHLNVVQTIPQLKNANTIHKPSETAVVLTILLPKSYDFDPFHGLDLYSQKFLVACLPLCQFQAPCQLKQP